MEKKTRLKILIVTQYFWPENFRINDLVYFLKNKNLEVEILTGKPNYPGGKIYEKYEKDPDSFKSFCNCNVHRVPILSRGSGSNTRLVFNYISFLISSIIYGIFKFRKKKFDYIFTFGTSPLTVALTSIILAKFCKSKTVLWVLDLWPEIIFDLGIFKNLHLKKILSKIMIFMFNRTDIILAQSKTYVKLIKAKINNNEKVFFFPSWPEIQQDNKKLDTLLPLKLDNNYLNIFFTGSVGDAQNYKNFLEIINKTKSLKIKWYIIGGGRRFKELIKIKSLNNLFNLELLDHISLSEVYHYQKKADILFISLKEGEALSGTIPGKFSTYLKFKKPILGLISGETKDLINNYGVGLAFEPNQTDDLINQIPKLLELKQKNNLYNTFYNHEKLLDIFSYEKNLENFFKILKDNINLSLVRIINRIDKKLFDKNFVISGLNLAFLSHYMSGDLNIYKNLYHWPDGLFKKFVYPKKIKKIPGRDLLNDLVIPEGIETIHVLGYAQENSLNFLKKKFNKNIIHSNLPFGSIKKILHSIPILKKNTLCILTLPTPKQEQVAEFISKNQSNYKILCIGGALNMLTGQEKPCPKFLENYGLETIWRLRTDTLRRSSRLFKTIFLFIYHGIFVGKLKNLKGTIHE